jgi:hypothetical protein
MVMNKYNKRYSRSPGFDTQNRKIIITNNEDPAVDESVQRKTKLVVPRGRNSETLVAQPPTPGFDSVKIHHEIQPRGGLKALQDRGLKITSYSESDGAGRVVNRRYEDEDYD